MVRGLGKVSEALGAFRYPPYKVPSDWPDIIFKSKTCEPSATLHIWYRVQISETKSLNLISEALIEQIKQNTRWCKTGKSFFWNHLKIPSQAEALSRVRWIIENRFSSITLTIGQWPISIWTMLVFHLLTAIHFTRALPSFSWLPGFLLFILGIALGVLIMVALMLTDAI